MSRVALRIFPIFPAFPDEDIDRQNSRDLEIAMVELAYRETPDAEKEIKTVWRDGIDAESEIEVLRETADWLQAHDFDELLTYGGTLSDIRHLIGRAGIRDEDRETGTLVEALHAGLRGGIHRDLVYDIERRHGPGMSFDDVMKEYDARPYRSQPRLWGKPISVGQLYEQVETALESVEGGELSESEIEQVRVATAALLRSRVWPLFVVRAEFNFARTTQTA